jgi:hypothetical protein
MLNRELKAFLEEGLIIHIATRTAALEPNGGRAAATTVSDDGTEILAFVPAASASAVLDDLRANGQVSLLFTRPVDERGCQVKGVFVDVRDARPDERPLVVTQWDGARSTLEQVGVPRAATDGWAVWPAVAVRIRVTAVFDQTPGPGAGAPLA